jgi:uncharacterized protein (AIM24 family)
MADSAALLKRARELFQQGFPDQAEEIVGLLLRDNPRDATALNFRAYLLYRRGNLDDALAAYRRLGELEPLVPGHAANLGLICFKAQRYLEAQSAFERMLELQPGDAKALRNLGFCHERQQSLEKALDCFSRAGDEAHAARIRAQLAPQPPEASPAVHGSGGVAPWLSETRPAAERERAGVGRPLAALEPDLNDWIERICLPPPGDGAELLRTGAGEIVTRVRGKVYLNPAYCAGERGAVVFAPAQREASKAAARYGERHGVLARAEGNGELLLCAPGRELHALHLGGGRMFVNWGSLVLCGTEIGISFEPAGAIKETFLAVELAGAGPVMLAIRGAPVVLPVSPDAPTRVLPESVVAWTEGLGYEPETVPELKKLLDKRRALRFRFEGRGHLVLQSC